MRLRSEIDDEKNTCPGRLPLVLLLLVQIALIGMEACSAPRASRSASAAEPTSTQQTEQGSMLGSPGKPPNTKPRRPIYRATIHVGPSAPAPGSNDLDESREQQAFDQIVRQAKTGGIQYHVPPNMSVGAPVTVTVEIYGANANPKLKKAFQATGSGTLKVITPMMVALSQPDNPDAFKIVPDPTLSGDQFLPQDGKADWVWNVTPVEAGPKKLKIDAYMVLNAKLPNGQPMMREVESYTVQVPVKVKPRMQALGDFFAANWDKLLGYVLPSGAVVLFLIWLFSRKKKTP